MEKLLKGKFIKVTNPDGSQNFEESFWEVWSGDEFIMKKSVKQLYQIDNSLSYELIATPEFGKKLLAKIRKNLVFW